MANSSTETIASVIWCLFSIENNYDQPDNNLIAWWREKPSLEILFSILRIKMGERDVETVFGVNVWSGKNDKHPFHDISYRLEEVTEGRFLD